MLLSGVILITIMISSNPNFNQSQGLLHHFLKIHLFPKHILTLEENTTYRFVSKPFISLIKPCMIDTPSNIPL